MKLKKTIKNNYLGYFLGYYVFIYRRPHGKWCVRIGKQGAWLWSEGYHGTYLGTLDKAKRWAINRCKNPTDTL